IKLQSKGTTILKAAVYSGILGIAGLVILSNNSEFQARLGEDSFSFKTDGLLHSVSDFLDRSQERKIRYEAFQDSIKNLKVKVKEDDDDNEIDLNTDKVSDEVKEKGEENN